LPAPMPMLIHNKTTQKDTISNESIPISKSMSQKKKPKEVDRYRKQYSK
jgi:hypothetical protein